VFASIDFSKLRSLTVFGEWRSFYVSEKMELLRVLDLEDASGVQDEDQEQMMKQTASPQIPLWRCQPSTGLPGQPEAASESGYQGHGHMQATQEHRRDKEAAIHSS